MFCHDCSYTFTLWIWELDFDVGVGCDPSQGPQGNWATCLEHEAVGEAHVFSSLPPGLPISLCRSRLQVRMPLQRCPGLSQ